MLGTQVYDGFFQIVNGSFENPLLRLAVMAVVAAVLGFGFVAPFVTMAIWAERRVAARIQVRVGPNRVGWFGLLQGVADGIKFIGKEYILPSGADAFFYQFAPVLVFAAAYIGFVALPFSQFMVVADFNIALFFIFAITSLETIGVIMAGWASNNKWSMFGALRECVQVVSYEIPLMLSLLIATVMYGTMSLMQIQDMQDGAGAAGILAWGIFRSPLFMGLGAILFYTAGLASCKRAPFDLPDAESELVAGYHTEYGGMNFGMFFFAEYASMYIICAVMVLLFFGGSNFFGLEDIGVNIPLDAIGVKGVLPLYLGNLILVGKACIPYFIMLQLRWTLPRYRLDQVIDLCLKVLLPFCLVCIVGQAVWSLCGMDDWAARMFPEAVPNIGEFAKKLSAAGQ